MHLLSIKEIEEIFNDGYLYQKKSFFILDNNSKTYDQNCSTSAILEEAAKIRNAYLNGHTIIVKNLEQFNPAIRKRCSELGREVDVHLYLVSEKGGTSFDFHTDDRDVYIHMIYGEKDFIIKETGGEKIVSLKKDDLLFIPKGAAHKALIKGASCLLSFGVDQNLFFPVYGGIKVSDLDTNQVNL